MQFKKGESLVLTITDIAFGGAGIAKIESDAGTDFVIFVSGAVPGDRVEAKLTKIKKSYAEAQTGKIITPSDDRIKPRCKHFGVCGGCSLQCLSYEKQLEYKEKTVIDSFEKIGGFRNLRVEPIVGCEQPWFYRNKMEYSFGPDKNSKHVVLGLHPRNNYKEIFDLDECFLESEMSLKILLAVKDWAREKKLTSYDPRSNQGLLRNLTIREGKNTGETLVNLAINGEQIGLKEDFKNWIMEKFPKITSLYLTCIKIQKGFKTVTREYHLAGRPALKEILACKKPNSIEKIFLEFEILPQAFFQPNTVQAQNLYEKILEFAPPKPREKVLDMFCGTGTIGMFFAKCGAQVVGADSNRFAIENAKNNARRNGIENIGFECKDAPKIFDALPGNKIDILITDPPRAGIDLKPLKKLLSLKIPKWIYVSCNPTTLARDLKIACAEGYKLIKTQPVDMFPHTYHVETVCLLRTC